MCSCVVYVDVWSSWSVCEVVLVLYVDTMTVILLFLLCVLRECEGDGNANVADRGGVVVVSAGHVGGIRARYI